VRKHPPRRGQQRNWRAIEASFNDGVAEEEQRSEAGLRGRWRQLTAVSINAVVICLTQLLDLRTPAGESDTDSLLRQMQPLQGVSGQLDMAQLQQLVEPVTQLRLVTSALGPEAQQLLPESFGSPVWQQALQELFELAQPLALLRMAMGRAAGGDALSLQQVLSQHPQLCAFGLQGWQADGFPAAVQQAAAAAHNEQLAAASMRQASAQQGPATAPIKVGRGWATTDPDLAYAIMQTTSAPAQPGMRPIERVPLRSGGGGGGCVRKQPWDEEHLALYPPAIAAALAAAPARGRRAVCAEGWTKCHKLSWENRADLLQVAGDGPGVYAMYITKYDAAGKCVFKLEWYVGKALSEWGVAGCGGWGGARGVAAVPARRSQPRLTAQCLGVLGGHSFVMCSMPRCLQQATGALSDPSTPCPPPPLLPRRPGKPHA
jgi:hypothetical protein